jgi:TetR/AcrR family tetracycline transcriptional repressor
MALDRDLIVRTALRLLDEVGLETLSLRRLARELHVHASALYWHFTDKQDLLDEMARAVMLDAAGEGFPQRFDWRSWLTHLARAQRRAILSHRDGAQLLLAAQPTADYQLDYLATMIDLAVQAGLPRDQAGAAFIAVTNYAVGSAIAEQRGGSRSAADDLRRRAAADPRVGVVVTAAHHGDETFERGLGWLLDGMGAAAAATPRAVP